MERDLAQLTLSDPEQRELYEAARLVQTAFCKYKVQAHPPPPPPPLKVQVLYVLQPERLGVCLTGWSVLF